ncbi:hypothetical protein HPP92_025970 [Vanilla planifolia]|uniref:C2H2-type domain-containing protein n=1 Tax=Vanilla planifolia TaxID=51239 RepID=A0A835PGC2_VANPL|nr:hypothetical protein HPP92_025970 [Vanilla planifolia]
MEERGRITSSSDEEEVAGGTGVSYDCIFCKRGFTTAQALGGHMNIHRKDRAKIGRNNDRGPLDRPTHGRLYLPPSPREDLPAFVPPELALFGGRRRVGPEAEGVQERRAELEDGGLDLELRLGREL